jgi:hypothetical protein
MSLKKATGKGGGAAGTAGPARQNLPQKEPPEDFTGKQALWERLKTPLKR